MKLQKKIFVFFSFLLISSCANEELKFNSTSTYISKPDLPTEINGTIIEKFTNVPVNGFKFEVYFDNAGDPYLPPAIWSFTSDENGQFSFKFNHKDSVYGTPRYKIRPADKTKYVSYDFENYINPGSIKTINVFLYKEISYKLNISVVNNFYAPVEISHEIYMGSLYKFYANQPLTETSGNFVRTIKSIAGKYTTVYFSYINGFASYSKYIEFQPTSNALNERNVTLDCATFPRNGG